jgi:poly-gamma-glutamate synthesis protein (capsule biosynthesis protein)
MHLLVSIAGMLAAVTTAIFPSGSAVSYMRHDASTAAQNPIKILFGGDMFFDRAVRNTIDKKGGDYIFSCIDPTLQSADLVVANLEGPITQNGSVSATSTSGDKFNMLFTMPTPTASLLAAHHIGVVNLGNNHILNFKRAGSLSTIATLDAAKVDHFGDPINDTVVHKEVSGVKVTLINYNEFGGKASSTVAHIREARAAGTLPIVYTHWGIEYATTSTTTQQKLAHRFIDEGAEIVIGSHPHVVQEHEMYHGKYIYYSLGNFIFDQYFSDDVMHGLLLKVAITKKGVQGVKEILVVLQKDRRTCVVE